MIDTLLDRSRKAGDVVAYVYCDYRDHALQTTVNIVGGMLKQLLLPLPELPREIIDMYEKARQRQGAPLELSDAVAMLFLTCKTFNRVYLCLDALDECKDITQLLRSLQATPTSIRLFTTGRKHIQTTVRHYFDKAGTIPIEAKEGDIRAFIRAKIHESSSQEPDIMDEKLEEGIIERIVASSKGMSVQIDPSPDYFD